MNTENTTMTQATIQITPGDDTHLTLLMAPQSLNFVTGQDREHLLAFGRAAFEAGRTTAEQGKCLHQIAEPAACVEKQIEEVMVLVNTVQKNRVCAEMALEHKDHYNEKAQAAATQIIAKLRTLLSSAQSGEQVPFMYAIADGYGNAFFEEQGCVSSEAKDLQPEVDGLNENLDGEPPYKVVAVYTHQSQALEVERNAARWREVIKHIGAESLLGGARYVICAMPAPLNVMRGSVVEHFAKTVDASIAASQPNREVA